MAIGATKEQLEKSAKTTTVLEMKVEGDSITTTRNIGSEAEYNFLEHKIKCAITGKDGDIVLKAVSGWATATSKLVGDKLVETITHNESGQTLTNTWERA